MGECTFSSHDFKGAVQEGPDFQQVSTTCSRCGVGHTLLMRRSGPKELQVDITIFPADLEQTVSRDIFRWAILACEGTFQEMERDGFQVQRGETTVMGQIID